MASMSAVVADGEGGLRIEDVPLPEPRSDTVRVRLRAFSLNRGEVRMARGAAAGRRVGWDVAGVVERAAAFGGGPVQGARVVGFCRPREGWAEVVELPLVDLAPIPDAVCDAVAASLPVAGLTALYCLDLAERPLGGRALVTGATGGVGAFAVQLARLAGLRVTAQMRREEDRAFVEALGPDAVVVTEDGASLDAHAPFDLVIDGVGGALLGAALKRLTTDGLAVTYAGTADTEVRFDVYDLAGRGRARLHGLNLYAATEPYPAARGFARLLGLCAAGRLAVPIAHTEDWTNTDTLARALMERRFRGKAVLTVGA